MGKPIHPEIDWPADASIEYSIHEDPVVNYVFERDEEGELVGRRSYRHTFAPTGAEFTVPYAQLPDRAKKAVKRLIEDWRDEEEAPDDYAPPTIRVKDPRELLYPRRPRVDAEKVAPVD